jgi:hypothetical protein
MLGSRSKSLNISFYLYDTIFKPNIHIQEMTLWDFPRVPQMCIERFSSTPALG